MKLQLKLTLHMLLCGFLLAACSSNDDTTPPSWINSPDSLYPSTQYLTAVGQASKRDRASNVALANLAKIFTVEIEADSSDLTSAVSTSSLAGMQTTTTQELSRNIVTNTELELQGAIIKEAWQSPTGDYYALAILEKQKAARHLTQTIRNADKNTQQLISYSSNQAPNIVLALTSLRQARAEQIKREVANKQLVQVANQGIVNKTSSKEIETLIKLSLAELKVATAAESERSNNVLQSALGQLGIPHAIESNLTLKANLDTIDPTFTNQWYWLRGSYDLSILDGDTVISSKRWPIKISAKEEQLLEARLQDQISAKLPDYLIELLSTQPTQNF
ncbi:LPP20 family lipoprotein [Thalassomonas sp. M1454]|uniref:LPP20 family lipoprotein n=1 Tax=Thalassomonas sp. M1454 TaxID=2594477 RepID=UPI00117F040C|nr:LPP20 family lipoprotein [Thalassomonas sp. M1454]TRX53931.1 hypothetical protein FNN08_13335 [Thalassomonas sp. M1454]